MRFETLEAIEAMEGKPVWVGNRQHWDVIRSIQTGRLPYSTGGDRLIIQVVGWRDIYICEENEGIAKMQFSDVEEEHGQ